MYIISISWSFKVGDITKKLIEASPGAPFLVHRFDAGTNAKALDNGMKQIKALSPDTSAMFFSVDEDEGKIMCMSCCSKV